MYNNIKKRFSNIFKTLKGHGKITESNISDTIRDIRRALLEADVNYRVVKEIINSITLRVKGDKVFDGITPGQQFIKIIHDEIESFLSINTRSNKPISSKTKVILMVGLQGTGKTTTAAKLAFYIKNTLKKDVMLIGADINRLAAKSQLEKLSSQVGVDFYSDDSTSSKQIIENGLAIAHSSKKIVIIDTAGRTHIDSAMMDEIEDINKSVDPDEIFYVVDSMSGQDAVNSCISFNDKVDISGIILSKVDSDARGGAALSVSYTTKKPIIFIGDGEGIKNLDSYNPKKLTKQILGMSDIVSFVDKIKDNIDQEEAEKLKDKMLSNQFNFHDFKNQMNQMKKLGPLSDIIKSIPGIKKGAIKNIDNSQMIWMEAVIDSMTNHERSNPGIIDGSRKKRIALGSGRTIQEVNSLLKNFNSMKKMMKNKKITSYINV